MANLGDGDFDWLDIFRHQHRDQTETQNSAGEREADDPHDPQRLVEKLLLVV